MVDWRRVGVLSAAVVITGGVFYVLWSLLSSRRRRKRRADEEPQPQFLPQPVPQQVKADEKLQSPSQPVRLQAEAGEKPKSPPLSQAVQQPEVDEKPQSLAQPQHVRQESEAQLFQPQHVREESEVQLPQHVLQESEVQLSQPQHVRQESEVQLSQLQHVRQESHVQLPQHVWQESEVQLEERRKEEPREEEEPPPQLGEPFQQVSTTSEPPLQEKPSDSKYVLVLGLDGAGKSSILNSLAASRAKHCATPTEGLNALCIATEDAKVEFLELGGSENLRSYWNMYLSKAHLLIFVVDSADHARLPLAKRYLFEATNINPLLPVMILANKQDLEDAFSITQIHEALSLSEIGGDRKLFLISTHVALEGAEITTGLQDAKDLISQIVMNTFDLESKAPSANLANELEGPMDEAK